MKNHKPVDLIGEKSSMVTEKIHQFRLKRRMNKMDKWKPGIIASMREEVENKCHAEYEKELERLGDEVYELRHINNELSRTSIKNKAKADEYKELYEKLLDKHEQKTEDLGATREKLEATEEDLKEAKEADLDLSSNADFVKELKMLVARCNNEKYNKAESMSSFSAKWNVSLKEVLDEEEKIVDFKWKAIQQ